MVRQVADVTAESSSQVEGAHAAVPLHGLCSAVGSAVAGSATRTRGGLRPADGGRLAGPACGHGGCAAGRPFAGGGAAASDELQVGFAHAEITPELRAGKSVWLAGYYPGRAATDVHDPLFARCVVLRSDARKIAWVSVDLIGLQYPAVRELRRRLPDFAYVLVASTHNHEGPDVIGVWGRTYLHRGVDEDYVTRVVDRMEQAVRQAEQGVRPARAVVRDGDRRVVARRQAAADRQGWRAAGCCISPIRRTRRGRAGRAVELPSRGAGPGQHADHRRFPAATIAELERPLSLSGRLFHRRRWADCSLPRGQRFATNGRVFAAKGTSHTHGGMARRWPVSAERAR